MRFRRGARSKSIAHPESFRLLDSTYQRAEQLLHEMIARDFNHPALIIWTIINEDWGTTLPLENASSAQDRAWVAHMYDLCKQLDPTRLVVDNSPCGHAWGPNVHVKTDLDDFHMYFNIPDQAAHFSYALEQFALRPLWTFSSQGDAQRTGHEPLILSEFGNWGLPTLSALRTAEHDPEWFDLGPWWSPWDGEPGWPRGVAERFAALGLDAVWPDYDAFATASQWHQFRAMKFELETMRRLPTLAGYVITEFTDAYWESNGLLDFNRAPKAYHNEFAMINAPDVLIPELPRYATWDDQPVAVRLYGAHYSATDWIGGGLTFGKTHQGEHGVEIGVGRPHVVHDAAQRRLQRRAIIAALTPGGAGELDAHPAFKLCAVVARAPAQQPALGVALDRRHRVQQLPHDPGGAAGAGAEGGEGAVHQEWHVVVDEFNDRTRPFPAMFRLARVEDAHFRRAALERVAERQMRHYQGGPISSIARHKIIRVCPTAIFGRKYRRLLALRGGSLRRDQLFNFSEQRDFAIFCLGRHG